MSNKAKHAQRSKRNHRSTIPYQMFGIRAHMSKMARDARRERK